MMSKQKLIGIVVVVVIVALGIGIWAVQTQSQSEVVTGPKETVTLGFAPALNYLTIIALEQGYFSSGDLELTVKEYATGKRALQDGLLAGEVEVAIVGLGPLAFEFFERDNLRLFGSVATHFDLYKIVTRKDRGILAPADLAGKQVGTSKASSFHYFLHNYLIENEVTEADVELVFKKAAELPEALVSGEIDAFCSREPFISEAVDLLGDNAIVLAQPELPANTLNLVTLASFIEEKPQAVEKILRALIQAESFAKENPDQAIQIVVNRLGVEESEVVERWSKTDLNITLGQELIIGSENIARWALRDNLIDKDKVPNFLEYIYLDGLESEKSEAVTIIR